MSKGIESQCRHCGRVFGTKTWRDEHARRCTLNPKPPRPPGRFGQTLAALPTDPQDCPGCIVDAEYPVGISGTHTCRLSPQELTP